MTKTAEQVERAYELLDFLEEHPEKHDQFFWLDRLTTQPWPVTTIQVLRECGTTACAAGWAVLLAGGIFISRKTVKMPSESVRDVEGAAAELLGLDDDESHALFYRSLDLDDVRAAIGRVFGPRPVKA